MIKNFIILAREHNSLVENRIALIQRFGYEVVVDYQTDKECEVIAKLDDGYGDLIFNLEAYLANNPKTADNLLMG